MQHLLFPALAAVLVAGTVFPASAQFNRNQYQYGTPSRVAEPAQAHRDHNRQSHRHHRRNRNVHVLSAWYGIEDRACNATSDVKRACEGRSSCTVHATNRLCGDPVPQVVKVLTVWYRCAGERPRSTTRWEGRYVGLNCRR